MAGDPKEVHVQVFLHPDQNPKFHLTSSDLPTGPGGELIFSNRRHRGFDIHFDLQEPTHGYLFPEEKDKRLAVWSEFGSGCCPEREIRDVFRAQSIEKTRKTLVARNANVYPELGKFGFTLRVVKGESDWLELDPPGDNRNGPIGFASLAIGVITGLVVGLGAAAISSNALDAPYVLAYALGGALIGLTIGLVAERF